MIIDISKINLSEPQMFILETLSGTVLQTLGGYYSEASCEICFNEVSTLQFNYPSIAPNYDNLTDMKIINWYPHCKWIVSSVVEHNDGAKAYKTVKCYSLEFELSYKTVYLSSSTYCLYNPLLTNTIMDYILEELPEWSIGTVSTSIINKFRNIDESSGINVYDFMKNSIQQKFGVIFDFDTNLRQINIISVEDTIPIQPVYLSLNNLIKSIEINQETSKIFTVANIYGAENLSIANCNPMGNSKLYDLSYYANTNYMSQSMVDKYNAWKTNYDTNKTQYSILNIQSALLTSKKATESAVLTHLRGELDTLTTEQSVLISAVASGDSGSQTILTAKNAEISAKYAEIANQSFLLSSIDSAINSILSNITDIVDDTQFDNYFTTDEYEILSRYFKETTISEPSFVVSSTSSYTDNNIYNSISALSFSLSNAVVTKITSISGKLIYTVAGGVLSGTGTPTISANVIRMTIERDTSTNAFTMSGYLATNTMSSVTYGKGCISITGTCSSITDTSNSLSFSVTGNLLYAQLPDYQEFAVALDLMEYGETYLSSLAQPSWEFNIDVSNFLCLSDFSQFKNAIKFGNKIYMSLDKLDDSGVNQILNPYLISMNINFDNVSDFKMVFSSKYCKGGVFNFTSLLEESIHAGAQVSLNSGSYNSFVSSGANNVVKQFMESALDIAKNRILSSTGQAITWDTSGINLAKWNSGGTAYEPEQIRMVNNGIIFSTDSWASAKMAIGAFTDANLGTGYGIIAPYIFGTSIVGNNFMIQSSKTYGGVAEFTFDANGARLVNTDLNVYASGNQISINSDIGIAMGRGSLYSSGHTLNMDNVKLWMDISTGDINSVGNFTCKNLYFLDGSNVKTLLSASQKKISNTYLDLGNIQLDGTTGDITTTGNVTLGGNINITGNIIWSSSNSPVTVQYSVNGSTSWHSTFNSADMFARYSYDGGTTWTGAIRIQGSNGTNGSDASVTRGNIVLAMLSANPNDGIYSYDLSGTNVIGINATAIKAGSIQGIDIYGGSYHNLGGSHRLQMGDSTSPYGVFRLYNPYYDTVPYFSIYDDTYGGIAFNCAGGSFMNTYYTGAVVTTNPLGAWDFQYATVTGLSIAAKFG